MLRASGYSLDASAAGAGLEAVLIGNAAAAFRGAPVTTVDFDFLFRGTARNLAKLSKGERAVVKVEGLRRV
jgi:hypothetical protein